VKKKNLKHAGEIALVGGEKPPRERLGGIAAPKMHKKVRDGGIEEGERVAVRRMRGE